MTDNVPFAAPPKLTPEVMGEQAWNEQMEKYRAWLESKRVSDGGSSGGGSTNAEEISDDDKNESPDTQVADEPAAPESRPMKSKRQDSGKPGTFNVYAENIVTNKTERVGDHVEAESPFVAIAETANSMDSSERNKYINFEARRQRGSGFKGGSDERRRNDPAKVWKADPKQGEAQAQDEFAGVPVEGDDLPADPESSEGMPEPEPPQADDIILHRLQSAPLIGQDAEDKISQIAMQAGSHSEELKQTIDALVASTTSKDDIVAMIDNAIADIKQATTTTINMVQPDGTTTQIDEHTHPLFTEVIRLATHRKPVYLYGPSGTGKTYMAEQVARALFPDMEEAERYFSISATMGMSESHLQGWRLPLSAGEFVYIPSEFVKKFEQGGVYLLDEVDRADPNVLAVLNQALANRKLPIPARFEKPYAKQHKNFVMLAAGNTAGTGADRLYTAATRLDEAFLDRFRLGTLRMDYDEGLEQKLVGNTILLRAFWYVRRRCAELNIERVISTRSVVEFSEYFDGATKAGAKTALERVTTTWEKAELNKINFDEALAA